MIIIGIDPGLDGAVAIKVHGVLWIVEDCPTVEVKVGRSKKRRPDPALCANLLRPFAKVYVHAFLEQVSAMKGQGVSSMFSFGTGYGIWQGVLAALQIPMTFVTPQRWQKVMLPGKAKGDKQAGRKRALELFPFLAGELKLKKHDGRGDALCIGEYGRRSMTL